MNAPEFSGVVDSFRPLLWALAIVIIIAAAVWGANQLPPITRAEKEGGAQPI